MRKVPIAEKVDVEIRDKLDEIVKESQYLDVSRSQVIEVILESFFMADIAHGERVRSAIIEKKKNKMKEELKNVGGRDCEEMKRKGEL